MYCAMCHVVNFYKDGDKERAKSFKDKYFNMERFHYFALRNFIDDVGLFDEYFKYLRESGYSDRMYKQHRICGEFYAITVELRK